MTLTRARWAWIGVALTAALASLWMREGFPVLALPDAMLDDGLFVRAARTLASGRWLGAYDDRTLIKGMFYPAFIAASGWLGLSLPAAEQAAYLAASAMAGVVTAKLTRRVGIGVAVFILLAANPAVWHPQLARVIRDGLYLSQTLGVIVLAGWIARPGRARPIAGVALGLLYGTLWLTREEGIWLVPTMLLMPGMAVVLAALDPALGPRLRGRLARCAPVLLSSAIALGCFAMVDLAVCANNWRHYGTFASSEIHDGAFVRAYGALLRVKPGTWHRYVVFPREVWEEVFAQSEAARQLKPGLEGPIGNGWESAGNPTHLASETGVPEIRSAWFVFALRDAVAAAGHYRDGPDTRAFYNRLADEVNAACAQGRLPCLPPRSSLAPPWHWSYVRDTLAAVPQVAGLVFTMGRGQVGPQASEGDPEGLAGFVDMVGPVMEVQPRGTVVRGWLVSKLPEAAGEPQLTVRTAQDGRFVPISIAETPAPDLSVVLPGTHGFRFVLDSTCDAACTLVLSVGGVEKTSLGWASFIGGPGLNAADVWLDVDQVTTQVLKGGRAAHHEVKRRIGHVVGRLYAACVPVAAVLALAGLLAGLFSAPVRKGQAAVIVLAAGAASAVVVRILLLAYLDATSLPVTTILYAACVTPAVLLFICLGLFLLAVTIRVRRSRSASSGRGRKHVLF